MLLRPSVERDEAEIEDLSLAGMDEDPLIYFLTPTPSSYAADDGMDFDMEFDAGIEDAKHPPQIVRSVSPSSLGGLSRPPPRPPTPPRSPSTPDLDYGLSATPDEYEQYDYMEDSWPPPPPASKRGSPLSLPRRLKDKFKGHHAGGSSGSPDTLAPPAPPHSPRLSSSSARGRATSRAGPNPIAASSSSSSSSGRPSTRRSRATAGRLSPHAWREPSPDVWAIEEEPEEPEQPEEEMLMHASELGEQSGGSFVEDHPHGGPGSMVAVMGERGKARAVDIPAAKPKKRVRFVLPAVDVGRSAY